MLKILGDPPAAPSTLRPGIPPAVDARIASLLAKDPGERPTPGGTASLTQRVLRAPRRLARVPARTWAAVLAVLVVVVAGALVAQRGGRSTTAPPKSIAVLPLENTSVDPEASDFLAEGIAQLVSARLSELQELRVTPWVTSRRFGDLSKLKESARSLNVESLMTGTYREVGNRIQVTVLLIDGRTQAQLWATTIEAPSADLFEVQRSISSQVAEKLLGPLSTEDLARVARTPAANVDAYSLYLRGVHQLNFGDEDRFREATRNFEAALRIDPGLAEAQVGLGVVLTSAFHAGAGGGADLLSQAREHFEAALAADSRLVSAWRGLGRVEFHRGDFDRLAKIRRSIAQVDSSSIEGRLALAEAYALGFWPELAIPLLESVLRDDPENLPAMWYAVIAHAWSGDFHRAIDLESSFSSRHGPDPEMQVWRAFSLDQLGRSGEAETAYRRAIDLAGKDMGFSLWAMAAGFFEDRGDSVAVYWCLTELEQRYGPVALENPDHSRASLAMNLVAAWSGRFKPLESYLDRLRTRTHGESPDLGATDYTLFACVFGGNRVLAMDFLNLYLEDERYVLDSRNCIGSRRFDRFLADPEVAPIVEEIRRRRSRFL
jgi:TolB-like protein/cytochrome c-type biogenesis protein CcmH/NrfG